MAGTNGENEGLLNVQADEAALDNNPVAYIFGGLLCRFL